MTAEEKEAAQLPHSMKERDRGGLFIPKECFMPFISHCIGLVQEYANEESYKKYGKNLLKVIITSDFWY